MHHTMKLAPGPFTKIKRGTKIIELRLNDEKRQRIALGDTITFRCLPELQDEIIITVTALLRYPTFKELIKDFPAEYFGVTDSALLMDDIYQFYTREDEKQMGVLGIKIQH